MAEEEKKKKAPDEPGGTAEAGEQAPSAPKKKAPSPVALAVIGLAAFVVFLGVFSFTMGVFSKKPAEKPAAEQAKNSTETKPVTVAGHETPATSDSTGEGGVEFNFAKDDTDTLLELTRLEAEKRRIETERLAISLERQQLETTRREVEGLLATKKEVQAERIAYLAKLFDGMKQNEVSELMAQLDDRIIVAVLPQMKPASASRVLAMLPPARAAKITTMLLGLDKS